MRVRNVSLLGLLAIIACVALGISHVITSVRLARVNSELSTLRKRLELIGVADTEHIAARQLPSSNQHTLRSAGRPGVRLMRAVAFVPASSFCVVAV
jgi:hypothetical protein